MAPRKIDPTLEAILKEYECSKDDIWDCHGTWVAYHRTLEKIAAKAGIKFDAPVVIEGNSAASVATLCVTGRMGERAEWSIGEASPKNNKNAYPFAMAEKRAKDRVIIKLVGLNGVYSEDEADDFKPTQQAAGKPEPEDRTIIDTLLFAMKRAESRDDLKAWGAGQKAEIDALPEAQRNEMKAAYTAFLRTLPETLSEAA
jgi:hypothetical protein